MNEGKYLSSISELENNYDLSGGSNLLKNIILRTQDNHDTYGHQSSDNEKDRVFIRFLKNEMRKLICSRDPSYEKERKMLETSAAPAVTLLTGLIVGSFGTPSAVATTIAATALYLPLKMGLRAWCEMNSDEPSEFHSEEIQLIAKIVRFKRK